MPEIAYVNGEFLPLDKAMVHVEDRGFQFADAVYEVVRTYQGEAFAVAEHVQRLLRSLAAIELRHDFTAAQLEELIREAVRRAGLPEAMLYMQITRGTAKRHRGVPATYTPTVVITVRELPSSAALREHGIKVITVPDLRWMRCDIKAVALLANVLAYEAAKKAGANDAVFVEADGTVNESTAGNIFAVIAGQLVTPPKGPRLLSGVTRDKILQASQSAGVSVVERPVSQSELAGASEVFLTSTTAEVVPVIAIDDKPVGTGQPGPVGRRVYAQFVRSFVPN